MNASHFRSRSRCLSSTSRFFAHCDIQTELFRFSAHFYSSSLCDNEELRNSMLWLLTSNTFLKIGMIFGIKTEDLDQKQR